MAAQTIENLDGNSLVYHGTKQLGAGESLILWTMGFPGSITVICGSTKSFMISAITDPQDRVIAGTSTDIDLEAEPITANKIQACALGVSAYKIKNGADSSAITVNWRIIRP